LNNFNPSLRKVIGSDLSNTSCTNYGDMPIRLEMNEKNNIREQSINYSNKDILSNFNYRNRFYQDKVQKNTSFSSPRDLNCKSYKGPWNFHFNTQFINVQSGLKMKYSTSFPEEVLVPRRMKDFNKFIAKRYQELRLETPPPQLRTVDDVPISGAKWKRKFIKHEIPGENPEEFHFSVDHLHNTKFDTHLVWEEPPKNVLVISKIMAHHEPSHVVEIIQHLIESHHLNVIIEDPLLDYIRESLRRAPHLLRRIFVMDSKMDYTQHSREAKRPLIPRPELEKKVDFIICIGGDGTVLYIHTLFNQDYIPPLLPFVEKKSLGFLLSLKLGGYRQKIDEFVESKATISERMKLDVQLLKNNGKTITNKSVVNEVSVHRGIELTPCVIKCYIDNTFFTMSRGDGMIVSTATGSTGYSISAGGPNVHPSFEAVLITPISSNAPLGFRPSIVPPYSIELVIPEESRTPGYVSFDGNESYKLHHGDRILINRSIYRLVTVNQDSTSVDWVNKLHKRLRFYFKSFERQASNEHSSLKEDDM